MLLCCMKTRESDMPDEAMWEGFFDAEAVLRKLGLNELCCDVVEFGCGYGTFTIPAARLISGTMHTVDIEQAMVARTLERARSETLDNVHAVCRDFVSQGTGLSTASVDYAMLFNILHAEEHDDMLREARRVLRPGGALAVMHWNYDAGTPRGPSMAVRPRPEELRAAVEAIRFTSITDEPIDLPSYHYGWMFRK